MRKIEYFKTAEKLPVIKKVLISSFSWRAHDIFVFLVLGMKTHQSDVQPIFFFASLSLPAAQHFANLRVPCSNLRFFRRNLFQTNFGLGN
jgi:hypothetical protein